MPLVVHTAYIGPGRLTIKQWDAEQYLTPRVNKLPQINFLHKTLGGPPESVVTIDPFWWQGQRSDTAYETLPEVFALTQGQAEILFLWDDGRLSAYEVADGIGKAMDVNLSLTPVKQPKGAKALRTTKTDGASK